MKNIDGKVSVTIKGVDGKENTIEKPVSYAEVETVDDVLGLLQGDKDSVENLIGALNYGFNLKARAKVTAQIKNENQGPEVSVNRTVEQIAKNLEKFNRPVDKVAIRAQILANPEMFGLVLN